MNKIDYARQNVEILIRGWIFKNGRPTEVKVVSVEIDLISATKYYSVQNNKGVLIQVRSENLFETLEELLDVLHSKAIYLNEGESGGP